MVMTLSRSGNGWSDGLHRSYDVWGSLRWNPSNSGDVKQRYCANLGHVEDDQSGLVYMRARFHEPWTGRFINQDPVGYGHNWFIYASNAPTIFSDGSGKNPLIAAGLLIGLINALISLAVAAMQFTTETAFQKFIKLSAAAVTGFGAGFCSVFGPAAMASATAFGCGLNTLVSEWVMKGFGGINWKKVGWSFGIGGAVGIAFGALGAAAGSSARIELELMGQAVELNIGEIAGGMAGTAIGDATSAVYDDANGF